MKGVIIGLVSILFFISFVSAAVFINEFTVDPQTDWDGNGSILTSDEFFELYNDDVTDVNLSGWNLSLIDSTQENHSLKGIIPAMGYFTILNPDGQQNNDGKIAIFDETNLLIDMVTYGNFNDSNISDNAPSGNADSVIDECLTRIPDGDDTDIDNNDFVKTKCTFNFTNNIIINNKSSNLCTFNNSNIMLTADVNGSSTDNVVFSYTINGTNINRTGSKIPGSLLGYFYTINISELIGSTVSWNVYANDSFGNNFSNGLKILNISNKTILNIIPMIPDGLNGWFVTEPNFTIINDGNAINSYYRWDAIAEVLFVGLFGLGGIPNAPPKESAGILRLNYWSEFACGNESVQNESLKVDLTNPRITNLIPANNSIIFENNTLIQALLDEVYQSNSGINHSSVVMKLDNSAVNAIVANASIDAILNFSAFNLSEGWHNISVYVEDLAGRNNSLNWSFFVNLSVSELILTVNSPTNESFATRRIIFNITTNREVKKIEFINFNDRRPRFRILCRNCDEYGLSRKRTRVLNEGENNITFRATNGFGFVKEINVSLFIDSRKPRILRILPRRNSITNGSGFFVRFIEKNLREVIVSFNPTKELNLSTCSNDSRGRTECTVDLNLTVYDGQNINYSFNVSDNVSTSTSRLTKITVDTSSPILNVVLPINDTYGNRVQFNISVNENVRLEYIDEFDSRPRFKRLCSRCDGFGDNRFRKKFFRDGIHKITIRAVDRAGNSDMMNVSFVVV